MDYRDAYSEHALINHSLTQSVVPICTSIVPVPKNVTCLNDHLVMAHINTIIPDTLDSFQFLYRTNRSTNDAVAIALHTALSHLYKRQPYVSLLLIDYSSALNTIVPSKLITKLRTL